MPNSAESAVFELNANFVYYGKTRIFVAVVMFKQRIIQKEKAQMVIYHRLFILMFQA